MLETLLGPPTLSGALAVYLDQSEEVAGRIERVYATAGGSLGHKDVVPHGGGIALGAGECFVVTDPDTGRSYAEFAAADAVTACRVEYRATAAAFEALQENEL